MEKNVRAAIVRYALAFLLGAGIAAAVSAFRINRQQSLIREEFEQKIKVEREAGEKLTGYIAEGSDIVKRLGEAFAGSPGKPFDSEDRLRDVAKEFEVLEDWADRYRNSGFDGAAYGEL